MKVRKSNKGYTILEVLIFIAVSAVIFVAAMAAISGRQQQVQFAQSVREFDAKIADLVNDVSTGFFPTNETISCQVTAGDVQINNVTAGGEKLGTSDDCLYVGKALQFQPEGRQDVLRIYTLAGKRYQDSKLTPSSTIANAKPKAVSMTSDATFNSSVEEYMLLYGLRVRKVIRPVSPSVNTDFGTIGLMSNFGGVSVSDAQSIKIGGIVGTSLGQTEGQAVTIINSLTDDPTQSATNGYINTNTPEGIVLCLIDQNNMKASVSLGALGSNATKLDIDTYDRGCDL